MCLNYCFRCWPPFYPLVLSLAPEQIRIQNDLTAGVSVPLLKKKAVSAASQQDSPGFEHTQYTGMLSDNRLNGSYAGVVKLVYKVPEITQG